MMKMWIPICLSLLAMACIAAQPVQSYWEQDVFMIWPLKKDAPRQTAVVSWSDWLVFGNATFGKPGVRYVINQMAEAGIREVWWRTFGGGQALYPTKIDGATSGNYPGQGADYGEYDSLRDAVEYAHKLDMKVHAWFTPLEEAHAWPDNVRSRYVDLHPELWDRLSSGISEGAPSFYYGEYRDYKLKLSAEMLLDYQVDGIVLDFERRGAPLRNDKWGYIPEQVSEFNRQAGRSGTPAPDDEAWLCYRASAVGKFVEGVKSVADRRKPKAQVAALLPFNTQLSAHWDMRSWVAAGLLDRIVIVGHGDKWGTPLNNSGDVYRKAKEATGLPTGVVIYTLNGTEKEISAALASAVAAKCQDLIWFESTYLNFNRKYNLPLAVACEGKAEISSPEYDFSGGGELVIVAAGNWSLRLGGKEIASGTADHAVKVVTPANVWSRGPLRISCQLPAKADHSGIAIQGWAMGRDGIKAEIRSNLNWTSSSGVLTAVGQPGIPPSLAPLDELRKEVLR